MIQFTAYGIPVPMARARVFMDKKTGKVRAANPRRCSDWKQSIAMQALEHRPSTLMDGPIRIEATFYLLKPKSKRAKYPATKPDWDNLAKALTDSLEGLIYTNDSRIVEAHIRKEYGDPPRVEIRVTPVEED